MTTPLQRSRRRRKNRMIRAGATPPEKTRPGVMTPEEWAKDWKEYFETQAKRKKGKAS